MKVLFILDNLSFDAGVTSIVLGLYKKMDRTKVSCDFLVCWEGTTSCSNEVRRMGSKVYYFGNPLSIKTLFRSKKLLKKFFKEHSKEYDVVHLHSPTLAVFTLKYAEKYGIKHRIVHSHSTMMSLNKIKTIINNYLISQIPKYANHYWACSLEAAKFLYGEKFCALNHVDIIHNAVDTKRFVYSSKYSKELIDKYCLKDNIIISHISNFSPIKNHMFLIDVIKKAINDNNKLRFLFVGDGPTKAEFEKELKKNGILEYCIFTGRTTNVQDYLMISDTVILPSIKEGLPVTIVEAQAAGVPCVISDTITNEVDAGMVSYLPLDVNKWARYLSRRKKLEDKTRIENQIIFYKSEFNLEIESLRVQQLYLDME